MKKNTDSISTSYVDIMEKNHMEIPWHDYTGDDSNVLISDAELIEKASVIGRVGLITLMLGIVKQKKNTKYRYPSDNIIIN